MTTKKKSESRYKVKAAKAGEATIRATAEDGRYGELKVEVKKSTQAVTSGALNKKEKELKAGEEYQLKATLKPKSAKNKDLVWLSTNEGIATVDQSGKVTAVGPGRVAIKAWTATGIKLKCMVTVK